MKLYLLNNPALLSPQSKQKPVIGQRSSLKKKKHVTLMSSKPEPVIWSHDTGQQITCFDSCQLTITWIFKIAYARLNQGYDLALGGVWQLCSTEVAS